MTLSRASAPRTRSRRRRNRKRATPIWRRVVDVRAHGRVIKRLLRRSVPALIAAALVGGLGFAGYRGYRFITTSERFAVRHIEVHGNQAVSSERITSIMGVDPGDNIFRLGLGALADKLEDTEPMIAHASVSRRLPATLIVDIEENQPAAVVELDGLYLADNSGRVFKRAIIATGDGAHLPVITGLSRSEYADNPDAVAQQIHDALDAAALYRLDDSGERPALGSIDLHPRRGITFTTHQRAIAVRVGHGDKDRLQANLRAFDAAWSALAPDERERVRIVYADVSNRPDRVTIGFQHSE